MFQQKKQLIKMNIDSDDLSHFDSNDEFDDLGHFDSNDEFDDTLFNLVEHENDFLKETENVSYQSYDSILPLDMIKQILLQSDIPTFIHLCRSNKRIKQLCDNRLW